MLLKRLEIKKRDNNEIIRTINFKIGPNFIVDMDNSKQHNKIGKTTLLKLIDIALGSKDKKSLYKDDKTISTNPILEKFITEQKICIELLISDSIDKPINEHTLYVELFKNGKRSIDNERLKPKEYTAKLNLIFFENSSKPSFRNLIHAFIRIKNNDNLFIFNSNIKDLIIELFIIIYLIYLMQKLMINYHN